MRREVEAGGGIDARYALDMEEIETKVGEIYITGSPSCLLKLWGGNNLFV